MKKIYLFAFVLTHLQLLHSQIWNSKNIDFAMPSQGWRIRAVSENTAWTFGFTIEDDPIEGWIYTDSEYTCQKTLNGGNTWEEKPFKLSEEDEGYICDIEAINGQVAYLTYFNFNDGPILYKTIDGGENWTENKAVVDYFLNWVQFYDANNGIAFGDPDVDGYFEIAFTMDGGVSWTQLDNDRSIKASENDEYGVAGDYAASGNYIYTRSDYDRIFYSSNKGQSWQVVEPPAEAAGGLWGLACNDRADLFAAYNIESSNEFIIFKRDVTTGEWIDVTPANSSGYLTGMASIPGTGTLLINKHEDFNNDQSFITLAGLNDGTSWLEVSVNQGYRTGFMEFYNAEVGYACEIPAAFENPSDQVFVYNGSPITGLYHQKPLSGRLTLFPNPTSDYVDLHLDSDDVCDYYILIYDVNGRLVDKKNVNQANGLHEQLQLCHLTNGSYTITVSNANGFLTEKIIKN
ncbi:MAG: T9SS type A sorting domain-containing protein [Saprospiraceae bacterium]|nr:T9SS type A sorting domain-containing protein [Saprospiraceae bacterium]